MFRLRLRGVQVLAPRSLLLQLQSTYYVRNHGFTPKLPTAMDGMTQLLSTTAFNVTAGLRYTIKLVIADGGDAKYDSLVWIRAGSLSFSHPPVLPVDCIGAFSAWGACSAACGGGSQSRTFTISTAATAGGQPCALADGSVETQACGTVACPTHCVGDYGTWSACGAPCGGGIQTAEYAVATPAANGGDACPQVQGHTISQSCNLQPCPPSGALR